jgi:hypothetical protein
MRIMHFILLSVGSIVFVIRKVMASVRPADDFPDASDMLAEALKQMDGLLAG